MTALHLRVDAVDGPPATTTPPARQDPIWLGTSWKMTKTHVEAQAWVDGVVQEPLPDGVETFVLPPITALHVVLDAIPVGSPLRVGVQNAHWAPDAPVTGEVSMRQVRDAGAQIVEIGHSDRRSRSVVAGLASGARLHGLLYGGSVTAGNAAALLRLDSLDGLLVSRAAWTSVGFAALLAMCGQVAAERRLLPPTHEQRSR